MDNYTEKINNKLEFLNNYNKNVKIIEDYEIDKYLSYIPKKWIEVFKENDMNIRILKALGIWEEFAFKELNRTIAYLKNNLMELNLIVYNDLISNNEKISALYTIKNEQDILFFEGNFNNVFEKNVALEQNWNKVPKSLVNFYVNIHNGFHSYSNISGLEELCEVTYFDDYYCIEDLEEYKNVVPINLKTTFGFFSNGSSDYVAIDISKDENESIIWYHDDIELSGTVDFWYEVDDWILNLFGVYI